MKGSTARELGEFFSNLHAVQTRGEHTAAAEYIKNHPNEIAEYVRQKRAAEEYGDADFVEAQVQRYRQNPDGTIFDEDECSLKLKHGNMPHHSFSLPTNNPVTRIGCYILAAAVLGVLTYTGLKIYECLNDITTLQEQRIRYDTIDEKVKE